MKIEKQLASAAAAAVQALYGHEIAASQVTLQKTKKDFEGHLTLVVFPFLRISKKKPQDTAAEIGEWIKANTQLIASFNAVGGFLNLVIAPACWVDLLEEINADPRFGITAPTVTPASPVCYDLQGRRIGNGTRQHGICIDSNGRKIVR